MRLLKLDDDWLKSPINVLMQPVLKALAALADSTNKGKTFHLTGFDYTLPNDDISYNYFGIFNNFFKDRTVPVRPSEMLRLVEEDDAARKTNKWRTMVELSPQSREPRDLTKREGWLCRNVLRHIFSYDAFSQGRKLTWDAVNFRLSLTDDPVTCEDDAKFNASAFINKIKYDNSLSMCPYCNAETIYAETIIDSEEKTLRSDLDHFLPKWQYPYFAMSPYNLVPSCARCNSRAKHDDDPIDHRITPIGFKYVHPYVEDFHEATKFAYQHVTLELLNGMSDNVTLDCFVDEKDGSRAEETVKAYCLRTVYERIYRRELKILPLKLRFKESSYFDVMSDIVPEASKQRFMRDALGLSVSKDEIDDTRFGKLSLDLAAQILD